MDLQYQVQNSQLLGQVTPADTNNTVLYSPVENKVGVVQQVIFCNTGAASIAVRLFFDANGTTYDDSTALLFDVSVGANTSMVFEVPIPVSAKKGGNLAVRSDTADDLTASAIGVEVG